MAGRPRAAGRALGDGRHLRARGRAEEGPSCGCFLAPPAIASGTPGSPCRRSAVCLWSQAFAHPRRLGSEASCAPALVLDSRDTLGRPYPPGYPFSVPAAPGLPSGPPRVGG